MPVIRCNACGGSLKLDGDSLKGTCVKCGKEFTYTAEEFPVVQERNAQFAKQGKMARIFIGIIIAAIVLALAFSWVIIPVIQKNNDEANAYNAAQELEESGQYYQASLAYAAMGDYSDAAQKAVSCREQAGVQVGDSVQMGTFNGSAIDWTVIAEDESGRVLLLADEVLEERPYNETLEATNWQDCSLRAYLNGDFYQTAFASDEQASIVEVTNENIRNPYYETLGCDDTQDKVFCLSYGEFHTYVANFDPAGSQDWWLRSPGDGSRFAAVVYASGEIAALGHKVDNSESSKTGVRPAVWIQLS